MISNKDLIWFLAEDLIYIQALMAGVFLVLKGHKIKLWLEGLWGMGGVLLIGVIIKNLTNTPRPYLVLGSELGGKMLTDGSFPSNHTAGAFFIWFWVNKRTKSRNLWLGLVAGGVAMGRILANLHWGIDVVGGIGLAIVWSWLFENIARFWR